MKNPKAKGSSFEREVAKKISLVLSDGKHDDWVWRTASSGGRFTQKSKTGTPNKHYAGDIAPVDSRAEEYLTNIVIECKHYKSVDIIRWMLDGGGDNGKWVDTLKETLNHIDNAHIGFLVIKENRKQPFVIGVQKDTYGVENDDKIHMNDFFYIMTFKNFLSYLKDVKNIGSARIEYNSIVCNIKITFDNTERLNA